MRERKKKREKERERENCIIKRWIKNNEETGGLLIKKHAILRALTLNDKMRFYGRAPREML